MDFLAWILTTLGTAVELLTIPRFATWLAQSKNQLRSNAPGRQCHDLRRQLRGFDPGDFDALIFPRGFRALLEIPQTRDRQASN